MSEKPDPRVEIMAQAWMRDEDKYGDADAESIREWQAECLAALESAGWRIVRLEDAGVKPVIEDGERVWEDVYRIIEEGPA